MTTLKKIWNGIKAGLTSTEAVKAEKSIATLVVTRVLLAIGASAAFVELAQKIIGG